MNEHHTGAILRPTKPGEWVAGDKKTTARFGAAVPLMPNGHGWGKYIPMFEAQSRGDIETYACTVFSQLKAWITLSNFLGYSLPKNCSERFNAIVAGITPPGANPQDVAESIRLNGVIADTLLPFDDSIHSTADYYHPSPMLPGYLAEAKKAVQQYELGHNILWNGFTPLNKPQTIKNALAFGPVCVSVYAWNSPVNGIYHKNQGQEDEHFTFITDYVDGQYWIVDDQYAPFVKHLAWDFDFLMAKSYFLQVNSTGIAPNDRSRFQNLLRGAAEALKRLLAILTSMPSTDNTTEIPVQPPTVPPEVPKPPPIAPAVSNMIIRWANSIAKHEGASVASNNPGNLKYSSLTASWGATKGRAATDGGYLAQFPYSTTGMTALCNFLTLGAENQLIAFHSPEARTLEGFTKIYAGNPPSGYTNGIIADMGVPGSTQISTFLV